LKETKADKDSKDKEVGLLKSKVKELETELKKKE